MGKFFANQKQDAPGLVGITLQKLLIFFMVLDVIGMFCGGSFFTSFLTLLFHFVVFMGVYRRRTAALCMYVVVHIVLFVIVALVLIVLVSSLMYMPYDYSSDSYYASASEDYIDHNNNRNNFTTYSHTTHYSNYALKLVRSWTGSNYTTSNSTTYTSEWGSDSWDSQDEVVDAQALFLFSVIFLVFFFIVTYTKILSVVLAHRMRKMLLAAPALPCHHDADAQTMEPTYVPADFEAQQQMFANQFAYAPMAPQNGYPGNQGAMMPPPFMYGNQPVFYTFAPMPPQQVERNEKL